MGMFILKVRFSPFITAVNYIPCILVTGLTALLTTYHLRGHSGHLGRYYGDDEAAHATVPGPRSPVLSAPPPHRGSRLSGIDNFQPPHLPTLSHLS